jgi:pimeloyl-ACP methyl ester carboxylesterase
MPGEINYNRHRFLGTAAMTIAAARLGMIGSADAQSSEIHPADVPTVKPGTHTSFGSLKQIDAGVLNVGYAEAGPADGRAVIYVAAFAPDRGESSLASIAGYPAAPGNAHYIPDYRPGLLRLDPAVFPHFFMQDVPMVEARALAATQKAAAQVIFGTKVGQAAWRTLPSWYLVSEHDRMINPDAERATARRIGATTILVRGSSHASLVSHPDEVATAIQAAARIGAKA